MSPRIMSGALPYEDGSPPEDAPPWSGKPVASKGLRHAAIDASICDSGLPSTQRLVLFALNRRIGWTHRKGRPAGTCHVSVARICHDSGLCERAVQYALRALTLAGWVVTTHVPGQAESTYQITPPTP